MGKNLIKSGLLFCNTWLFLEDSVYIKGDTKVISDKKVNEMFDYSSLITTMKNFQ